MSQLTQNMQGPVAQARLHQLQRSFTYHAPNAQQLPIYDQLRTKAKELAILIELLVPTGRGKSTALTKVEEAVMWANKGVAVDWPQDVKSE